MFLFFSLNISVFADEKKCGAFDLGCKTKKAIDNITKYQKEGLEKSKKQIKKNKEQIKEGLSKPLKKK